MIRRIIRIDEEKCNGCGLCAKACHEGAIGMVAGKAKLLREDYCDGLGDCLPVCPADAISFEEREAPAYNEAAVLAAKNSVSPCSSGACPGSRWQSLDAKSDEESLIVPSQLSNFPVQIKLVPTASPSFDKAELLIAADCCAYSYGNFHRDFIKGRITLIGCPKLDSVDYTEKLTEILIRNDIRSVTLTRMSVPCCGGLMQATMRAIAQSGKDIPLEKHIINPDGKTKKM